MKKDSIIRLLIFASLVSILLIYESWELAFSSYGLERLEANATKTTLEQILSGRFFSSLNKLGENGTLVEVDNLRVLQVMRVIDGDVHVHVTDGNVSIFVTEITPYWQLHGVSPPKVGDFVNITGVVFCDSIHQTEEWHGKSCWEIHPIVKITSTNQEK